MDFGMDGPEAAEHLQRQIDTIDVIVELAKQVQLPPEEGSDLHELVGRFSERPVFLGRAVQNYLKTTCQCLLHIRQVLASDEEPSVIILQSLLRPVLMAAGRVVFVLGSNDREEQFAKASIVLRQEIDSYLRALRAFSGFEHLLGFRAPPEVVSQAEEALRLLKASAPRRGEGQVLNEMADFISSHVGERENNSIMGESVKHAWHTFSGGAHGYVWPDNVPGDFIATFGVVVPVAHWAFDIATTRTRRQGAATS